MKFQELAPIWDKKLKWGKIQYLKDLKSFNTCIIGEITKRFSLPVVTDVIIKDKENKINMIPDCMECWALGVKSYKTIMPSWEVIPSEVKENIDSFYRNIVPLIETHFHEVHKLG